MRSASITQNSEGTIELSTTANTGTTTVPVASHLQRAGQKMRLLIVEDSNITRWQLVNLVKRSSKAELVGCAENGVQGVEMFIAMQPDAVLLDLQLPGITGFDLLPTIKREQPGCLVIVLTAFGDEATRTRCMQLGADYFFDKAMGLDQIFQVLGQNN